MTQLQPTDEMRMAAYRDAREWAATHGHPQPDDRMIDDVLAAALAIVEREHEIEIARLRARIKQAQESRNHWVRRALDAEERSAAPAPEAGAGHHAQDARPGMTEEIKLLEDGWVWRCWACGSLGSGHLSEAAARREFDRHPCEPDHAQDAREGA